MRGVRDAFGTKGAVAMSVAALYNLSANDRIGISRWGFNNMAEHFKIQQAIFLKHNINLPLFPLDPVPLDDLVNWGRSHQAMHSAPLEILGLQGNDLTVDFRKPEDVVIFTMLHADEHRRMALALGLT